MLSYDEALAKISDLSAHPKTETVDLAGATGRVLAAPVLLDRDVPGFDRATMDGFAVAPLEGELKYRVIGVVHAGENSELAPKPGEAIRIMTGAPCPPGVGVVPIEKTDGNLEEVTITDPKALKAGICIAWQGEDGKLGDVVGHPGQRLNPVTISAMAMSGATTVEVFAKPRVHIVTTGDEIGGEGRAAVYDSNGPLLIALLSAFGAEVQRSHAKDNPEAMQAAFSKAQQSSDIVVTVGGVSMGAKDLVPSTATAVGFRTVFHKCAMQPGKPALVCQHPDGGFLVGLPGNPVSVVATAHLILAPVMAAYLGGWQPQWCTLPLAVDHHHKGKRRLFLPAVLEEGVRPVRWNGSGDLLAAASCSGLIDLQPESQHYKGDLVRFLPYVGVHNGDHGRLAQRAQKR